MGAFLFYLIKSGLCLVLLYLLYRFLMSRTTFFRLNRLILMGGMMCCACLPLVELTTEKPFLYNPLHSLRSLLDEALLEQPFTTIGTHRTSDDVDFYVGDSTDSKQQAAAEVSLRMERVRLLLVVGVSVYLLGSILTLLWIAISTIRMWKLIRDAEGRKIGKYRLVITARPIGSFSWGRYMVISAADYAQYADEILKHEMMHLRNHHTFDLLFLQLFLVVHWFNPVIWLLRRELQEIHEYEADNGVINTGIDATRYQLLLVKKAVGTRLYSMANGFNHSKLKNRITMMLKERTNRWARLKLLLFVPVVAGTLYAFAQPEVKDVLQQAKPEVQQKTADDYPSLMSFFKKENEEWNAYRIRTVGEREASKIKEKQVHPLLVNAKNQILFDGEHFKTLEGLKSALVRNLLKSWEASGRKDAQVILLQHDRGSGVDEVTEILRLAKGAFEQIRTDLSATLPDKSKEYVDKIFPILLSVADPKSYGTKLPTPEEVITQVVITLHTPEGVETIENFTLSELEAKVTAVRNKSADKENFVVGLKADKNCKMGSVIDVKQVLRKVSALKINHSFM